MTNFEIITNACIVNGIEPEFLMIEDCPVAVTNVRSYKGWEKVGMRVNKGEKARFMERIWMPSKNKKHEEEIVDENGEKVTMRGFYLVKTWFFTQDQVSPIPKEVV